MISVEVRTLAGDVHTHRICLDGSKVADVAPQAVSCSSSTSFKVYHRGCEVRPETALADLEDLDDLDDLEDGSGVVTLVLVPYRGSRTKKKKRKSSKRNAEADWDGLANPTGIYSLANPGLDDIREDYISPRLVTPDGASPSRPRTNKLSNPADLVGLLRSKYSDRIHHEVKVEKKKARIVDFETAGIPVWLADCFKAGGFPALYEHQVEAWNAREGNFVVTTSTASGKTVCYLLPLMHLLNEDEHATAILLFPTKALARDQLLKARAMGRRLGIDVEVIDGDTEMSSREDIMRSKPRLIVTNPDYMSFALAEHETRYRWLIANLSIVVVDEAHAFTGVFGCHVAMVLRRLKRLARLYSARDLRFYMCSATLSNAAQFASMLCGEKDISVVDKDYSPSEERRMLIWRPALASNSRRKSPIYEAAVLLSECLSAGLTTIVFAKTRKLVELVYGYTAEILNASDETKHLLASLASYRAGFSPAERREIEKGLFEGRIIGVCATNALELGIDFEVDVVVTLGWPGSRASLWQQAGRAGRRGKTSVAFFVPFDGLLDNFFVSNPSQLFDVAGIEPIILSVANSDICVAHLRAAAYEEPLDPDKDLAFDVFGSSSRAVVERLLAEGELTPIQDGRLAYSGSKLPNQIQLRSIDDRVVSIVERGSQKVLEAIEAHKAPFCLYPGAIWHRQGQGHLVEDVDWSNGIARVVRTGRELNYYTTVVDCLSIKTKTWLHDHRTASATSLPAEIVIRFPAFCRRRRRSGAIIDQIELHGVPEVRFDTTAMIVPLHSGWSPAAVHAAAHSILLVAPRFLGVGDNDIGAECNVEHCPYITDRLLLFDRRGEFGFCHYITQNLRAVVHAAARVLANCQCRDDTGCPLCCHLATCSTYNANLAKKEGLDLLRAITTT